MSNTDIENLLGNRNHTRTISLGTYHDDLGYIDQNVDLLSLVR